MILTKACDADGHADRTVSETRILQVEHVFFIMPVFQLSCYYLRTGGLEGRYFKILKSLPRRKITIRFTDILQVNNATQETRICIFAYVRFSALRLGQFKATASSLASERPERVSQEPFYAAKVARSSSGSILHPTKLESYHPAPASRDSEAGSSGYFFHEIKRIRVAQILTAVEATAVNCFSISRIAFSVEMTRASRSRTVVTTLWVCKRPPRKAPVFPCYSARS